MTAIVISNTGGNWNSTSTWSPAQVPIAGDTVTATATSGNVTVTATAACASIDFTNYVGTFTINNAITLTLTSTFKMVAGMNVGGTGNLTLNGTLTLTSGGKQPAWNITLQGANTYTLGDNWQISGTLAMGTASNNLVINGNQFTTTGLLNTATTGTVSGTAKLVAAGTSWTATGNGTIQNNVDINTAGTVSIGSTVKYNTGTLHIVAGSVNTTGQLSFTGNMSLNMDGLNPSGTLFNVTITVVSTITNLSDVTFSTLTLPNANATFAGSFDVSCGKITNSAGSGRTYTFVSAQTLHVGILNVQSNSSSGHHIIKASTPGSQMKLKVDPGVYSPSNQNPIYVDLTDVDATPGNFVVTYGGTLSNCLNCFTTYPTPNCRAPVQRMVVGQ